MNDYDGVIVGCGTIGCVLARRLTDSGDQKVLLLEAGPDYPKPRRRRSSGTTRCRR